MGGIVGDGCLGEHRLMHSYTRRGAQLLLQLYSVWYDATGPLGIIGRAGGECCYDTQYIVCDQCHRILSPSVHFVIYNSSRRHDPDLLYAYALLISYSEAFPSRCLSMHTLLRIGVA